MPIVLGAIADDFTGATDLANNLVRGGMRCVQRIGVPEAPLSPQEAEGLEHVDAIVVALKSRSFPAEAAVADSLAALEWLRARGARQIFFKYCSTFDSTDAGNIGPVSDALIERLGGDRTVMVPAFPANGRTVYQGHLFVGDRPLDDGGQALGFWTNRLSTVGRSGGVGHGGFTGTELLVDPERELVVVLLTNRQHPGEPYLSVFPVWTGVLEHTLRAIEQGAAGGD